MSAKGGVTSMRPPFPCSISYAFEAFRVGAALALLAAGCTAQPVTHDPVAVTSLTARPTFLTEKQYNVVLSISRAASANERRRMMVTVFKGVLILYVGDAQAPKGLVKPGTGECLRGNTSPCRECYGIIGSGNGSYCPQPVALLPTGSRVISNSTGYLTPLDKAAQDAYRREGVDAVWDPKPGHFFDATR